MLLFFIFIVTLIEPYLYKHYFSLSVLHHIILFLCSLLLKSYYIYVSIWLGSQFENKEKVIHS